MMRRSHSLGLVSMLLAMLLTAKPARGQEWTIEAQAGRMRSSLDPSAAPTENVALGIRYADALTQFRVSAAVPTEATQPLWGAISGSRRLVLRHRALMVGADLTALGFVLHDRAERTQEVPGPFGPTIEPLPGSSGFALAGQALPLIGLELGRIQLVTRAGLSQYESEFGDNRHTRTVRLADVQVLYTPAQTVAVVPVVRLFRAEEDSYTYAGLTGVGTFGRASVWGTVGRWPGAQNDELPWSAGASYRVHRRATLSVSAWQQTFDPLYLTAPQTAWTVAASVRVGGKDALPPPVPAQYVDGYATIRLPRAQATTRPRIAGDFNSWQPEPMQLVDREWTYTVAVAPGVYNYAFVDEQNRWFVPEKFPGRKDDGMGGHVAVLVVQQ